MPVKYTISESLILITFEGIVTNSEILDAQREMFNDPDFEGTYPRLVDGSGITELKLTASIVRHVAQSAIDRGMQRAALISNNSDTVYGLMRMYEGYSHHADVRVFKDRASVDDWIKDGRGTSCCSVSTS